MILRKKTIIMGAGGRDFHNFNTCFRDKPEFEVVAFTAAQIPLTGDRSYPPQLSGPLYPEGIPIFSETKLPDLIKGLGVSDVFFSYSDVSHEYVMHMASLVIALGGNFHLLGAERTMISSSRPVISVCAVRTGCGKSGLTKLICRLLKDMGKRVAAIRHPMAYRDLLKQRVERFETYDDLASCTIEEREEFEPLIDAGITVFAGVDYVDVLREAEKEAEIIVWDGGNNDLPFIRPGLEIVVMDPHRAGDEVLYYPGEANLRRADCLVINKMDTAREEDVKTVLENIKRLNPDAKVIYTVSGIRLEKGSEIKGKRCLVVEDGPTLTHGGMAYGAGVIAAKGHGAELVDPRGFAVGSIKETLDANERLTDLVPAMGYSREQIKDLEDTINRTPCDIVLIATPADLGKIIKINKPCAKVIYEVNDIGSSGIRELLKEHLKI